MKLSLFQPLISKRVLWKVLEIVLELTQSKIKGTLIAPALRCSLQPPLNLPQKVHILLILETPDLDAVLQVGSHDSGVEEKTIISFSLLPMWLLIKPRMPLGFWAVNVHCQVTLSHQSTSPSPSLQGCSQSIQPSFLPEIAPTQVKDLALGLVELHEVFLVPLLRPVQVPLDGIPSLRCVDHTTQLDVIVSPSGSALDPTAHITDKMLNSASPNPDPWGTPLTTGLNMDINTLTATIQVPPSSQFFIHLVVHPSNLSLSLHLCQILLLQ